MDGCCKVLLCHAAATVHVAARVFFSVMSVGILWAAVMECFGNGGGAVVFRFRLELSPVARQAREREGGGAGAKREVPATALIIEFELCFDPNILHK